MKEKIHVFDHANDILTALQGGVLLTTKAGNKVNTMTIGWGTLGIEWGKPIFIAYVREHRYTKEMLDQNPEFTINVPYGDFDKNILGFCGSRSGRDIDKFAELGLTTEDPDQISVPAIRQLPLTLECRVLYKRLQDKDGIPQDLREKYYPEDMDSSNTGRNRDYHIAYYGEIVSAYIVK